jgi:hypothetical protein
MQRGAVPKVVKNTLHPFLPLARRVLPRSVLRFILTRMFGANRPYDLASRHCLEDEILPWLAGRYGKILFVGTQSYTWHYGKRFRPRQFTTIDRDPNNAVWGARDHIISPVEEIGRHRPAGFFDCVILNGVFGFGVDDADHMRMVVKALHGALQPGGLLVVGWNTDRHADPVTLGVYESYFAGNKEEPWVQRRLFPPETHVYDFYVRQPD